MIDLSKKMLILKVTVHKAGFNERDKEAEADFIQSHNISGKDKVKLQKRLFPREVTQPVEKVFNAINPFIKQYTHPWKDGGWRLLHIDLYDKLNTGLNQFKLDGEEAVHNLISHLEEAKKQDEIDLNSLYKEGDYPSAEDLKKKFGIDVFYEPVPQVGHIQVDMANEIVDELKIRFEENHKKALEEAMSEVHEKVCGALEKLIERFGAEEYESKTGKIRKPSIHESVLENLMELVDILPIMNLTGDPKLEVARQRIESAFSNISIKDVKEDETLKEEKKKEAAKILENLKDII